MELLPDVSGLSKIEVGNNLGQWVTGNWLSNKLDYMNRNADQVRVDFTTEGFDASKLVPILQPAEEVA